LKLKGQSKLEEIMTQWSDKDSSDINTIGISDTATSVTGPVTLDLSNTFSNVSLTSPYTYTSGINLGAFPNTIYTTNGTNTLPWMTQASLSSPKIQLNGESADIEVNGWSLVAAVKRIEQRLGLFQPNPELETEWSNLRELGEQYRKLEQQIKDKQATWDRLKAMPAPDID
jgi:hypothetical protein